MNVSCGSCPAKYAIPDDKVRGRKVRIVCKRCGAPIIVDGTSSTAADAQPAPGDAEAAAPRSPAASAEREAPAAAGTPAQASAPGSSMASRRRGMKQTMIGIAPLNPGAAPAPSADPPTPAVSGLALRDAIASRPTPAAFPSPVARSADRAAHDAPTAAISMKGVSSAEAPVVSGGPAEWTVAITDDQHEEMSTAEVIELYAAGTITDDTFIWKEGMEDWKTPLEIPAIAERIQARGLRARSAPRASAHPLRRSDPGAARAPIEKQGPGTPMGVWREPGSSGWGEIPGWSDPDMGGGEVSFDDVTVAMAAPQAEELLRAAGAQAAAPARGSLEERGPFSAESAPLSEPPPAPLPFGVSSLDQPSERGASGFETPAAMRTANSNPEAGALALLSGLGEERAALRDTSDRSRDLFAESQPESEPPQSGGARRSSEGPEDGSQQRMTGARNESSVLFSLDALIKPEEPSQPKSPQDEEEMLGLRTRSADAQQSGASPLEAGSGSLLEAALAAPEIPAAAAPVPASGPAPGVAKPVTSLPPAGQTKSHGWLWAIVLLLLALLGAGGALLLTRPKHPSGRTEPERPSNPVQAEPRQPAPPAVAPAPEPARQPELVGAQPSSADATANATVDAGARD